MARHDRLVNEPTNQLTTHPVTGRHGDPAGNGQSRADARLLVENQQLRIELTQALHAMAAREVIEQAKGLLMGHYRCAADAAFAVLRETSQRRNVKLRDLALAITDQASREGRVRYPGLDEVAARVLTGDASVAPDQRCGSGPAGWR